MTNTSKNKTFTEILEINLQLAQELLMYRFFNDPPRQKCCLNVLLMLIGFSGKDKELPQHKRFATALLYFVKLLRELSVTEI